MSAMNAIARDENVRNPLAQEIPDIFIPPTQVGNAGVRRGRNENSGMTTGDDRGKILSRPPERRREIRSART